MPILDVVKNVATNFVLPTTADMPLALGPGNAGSVAIEPAGYYANVQEILDNFEFRNQISGNLEKPIKKAFNISAEDFDPVPLGVSWPMLMERIHARLPDGTLIEGVEAVHRNALDKPPSKAAPWALDASWTAGGPATPSHFESGVLKVTPDGAIVLATAHDMAREYKVVAALRDTPVPVARA